jgi:probable rRNA maturation factor
MSRLHVAHLGLEGPTDVLSFPIGDPLEDPSTAGMGDIALNWAQVRRQARGPGLVAWMDEASVLLVHGFVHLLGHDHRTRREGRRMHRVERRLLRRIRVADIPRPYGVAG